MINWQFYSNKIWRFKFSKWHSFFRKSTWKMGGGFLLFSSKISGIDTSAQRYEHFLYKIHKNHEHLFLEHHHLVLEVDNILRNALAVWNDHFISCSKNIWALTIPYSEKFVYFGKKSRNWYLLGLIRANYNITFAHFLWKKHFE